MISVVVQLINCVTVILCFMHSIMFDYPVPLNLEIGSELNCTLFPVSRNGIFGSDFNAYNRSYS